jgi:hypothetical protein
MLTHIETDNKKGDDLNSNHNFIAFAQGRRIILPAIGRPWSKALSTRGEICLRDRQRLATK